MLQHKNKTIAASIIVVIFLALVVFFAWPQNQVKVPAKPSQPAKNQVAAVTPSSTQYDVDSADSLQAVVNKGRVLPGAYIPAQVAL